MTRQAILGAAVAAASLVGARAAGTEQSRTIEDFDRMQPGAAAGTATVWSGPVFSPTVVQPGCRSRNCLSLAAVPSDGGMWTLQLRQNLSGFEGIRLQARANRPIKELKVCLAGGNGFAAWKSPIGPEFREVRVPFANASCFRRFDPARLVGLSVAVWDDCPQPADVFIDSICAYGDARRMPRRAVFSPGMAGVENAFHLGLTEEMDAAIGIWTVDEETWMTAIYTAPHQPGSSMMYGSTTPGISSQLLAARLGGLVGATGISMEAKVEPATPVVIIKFWLREEGGEQFIALRDAPARLEEIHIPFAEFVPDAAHNLKVPAAARNDRLNATRVDQFGIDLISTTEEPFRGKLYLKGAWAVRK